MRKMSLCGQFSFVCSYLSKLCSCLLVWINQSVSLDDKSSHCSSPWSEENKSISRRLLRRWRLWKIKISEKRAYELHKFISFHPCLWAQHPQCNSATSKIISILVLYIIGSTVREKYFDLMSMAVEKRKKSEQAKGF